MLETLEALRGLLGTVNDRNRQQLLSTSGVLVSACDEPGQCPICRGPWHVQKTAYHHAKTIRHGQFEIRETIHVCADRCRDEFGRLIIRRAHCLAKHIVPGRTVGYDVMVFVGILWKEPVRGFQSFSSLINLVTSQTRAVLTISRASA